MSKTIEVHGPDGMVAARAVDPDRPVVAEGDLAWARRELAGAGVSRGYVVLLQDGKIEDRKSVRAGQFKRRRYVA